MGAFMAPAPVEVALTVRPRARIDMLDVRRRVSETHGDALEPFPLALYSSYHTTAGYLDQSLATRLNRKLGGLGSYLSFFRRVFPEGAGYKHDQLDLREELSEAERRTEPLNADSHLAFISAGLRSCVTYRGRNGEPVYFIDLDGVYRGRARQRVTTVLGYSAEEEVARDRVTVPMSAHAVESVSLKDPRFGVFERCEELIRRHGVEKGRIQLALAPGEEQAGLTVNEYETLLMRHDLAEVLRDPLRFMAENSRDLLSDPRSIPNKTINYAKYDLVRVFNEVFDVLRLSDSVVERILSRFFVAPARRFLQVKRSVSLPVSDRGTPGEGRLAQGRYQSPILMQWRRNAPCARVVDITLTRFR